MSKVILLELLTAQAMSLAQRDLDGAMALRQALGEAIDATHGLSGADHCGSCGSVRVTLEPAVEVPQWQGCGAVYGGADFMGEKLPCNIEHGEGEDHGHWMDRIIRWKQEKV